LLLYLPFMFPEHDSLAGHSNVQSYCARLSARRAYQLTLGARIRGAANGTAPPAPSTRGGVTR